MIVPSKEEYLSNAVIVQGARVLRLLKDGAQRIDDLIAAYPTKSKPNVITIERLLDVLTYLHILGFVKTEGVYIGLSKVGDDT